MLSYSIKVEEVTDNLKIQVNSFFRDLKPAENRFVSTVALGEGWHNYHHMFPFDYKAAEHYDFLTLAPPSLDCSKNWAWLMIFGKLLLK